MTGSADLHTALVAGRGDRDETTPGARGLAAGVHGAGVKAPDLAAVAAATAGLAMAPHIPNDGMLVSGT
jgi:hypothetical protein